MGRSWYTLSKIFETLKHIFKERTLEMLLFLVATDDFTKYSLDSYYNLLYQESKTS